MHSPPAFRSVKAKIRVLCKQRRIRLEEFMKTFDIHHVKKIKVDQFKRALDVSGLQLTTDEMNVIVIKYRFTDDPSFVDYRRFCDLIDKVFTIKGLEAKPELRVSIQNHEIPITKPFTLGMLNEKEQNHLQTGKEKLAVAVRNKGLVLKDVFHDFDRSNGGKVTKPQFVRNLLDLVSLSSAEVDAMVKAYGTDLDVNYRALHHDITPGSAGNSGAPVSPLSRSPDRRRASAPAMSMVLSSSGGFSSEDDAVRELEAALSELTIRDRIRTKNFFTDFDPLRTGKCTEAQFKRCVKLCFTTVTESDLTRLVHKYHDPSVGKVDYVRFCNYIEGKTNLDSTNKPHNDILTSITKVTLSPTNASVKCSREQRGTLSGGEVETYQVMMQRLGQFCTQRRILLKPSFQDFDKGHREHISTEQFFRVMTMLKLTLDNDKEHQVLLKRYASPHGDRFINYVTFCFDIEQWEENNCSNGNTLTKRPSSGTIASEILLPTRVQPAPVELRSVPMLMRYIKQTVKRDRIRMEEYYRDFDKLRHGKITVAQFAAGLNTAAIALSKDEVSRLSDEYAVSQDVDSTGRRLVAWKRFVEDVESVFTVKGLERNPHHDLTALQTKGEQFGGVKPEHELTAEEEQRVTQCVVSMKIAMDRQRLEIKSAFEDFDRSKQGFITATKFDRVLSMFHLLSEPSLARLLSIKFREQNTESTSTTLSSFCDVNYRAFLQALDWVGKAITSGQDTSTLVLPGSVAYRQGVYAGGQSTLDVTKRSHRDDAVALRHVDGVLVELRRQMITKRIRLKEFITEGDKLRLGEITVAKFHTAMNRSGCIVDGSDLTTLTEHFRSEKNSDKVDWRRFLEALDHSHDMRPEASERIPADVTAPVTDEKVLSILAKLRREVNTRRLNMKTYFQDYDHNRIARVTKFQFAAVLDMMKVHLTPGEVEALQHQFTVRHAGQGAGGRQVATTDVSYTAFILAVDSEYS